MVSTTVLFQSASGQDSSHAAQVSGRMVLNLRWAISGPKIGNLWHSQKYKIKRPVS